MLATYCQNCGQILLPVHTLPIAKADFDAERSSDESTCILVRISCPKCHFKLIAYDVWYENRAFAEGQLARMRDSIRDPF